MVLAPHQSNTIDITYHCLIKYRMPLKPKPPESAALSPGAHVASLASVGMFYAPPVDRLTPIEIRPGFEYIELLTAGVVLDCECGPERECGPGSLFWHLTGDRTIHRTRPASPYCCLCVQFKVTAPVRRAPRRSFAGDAAWARTVADDLVTAFHDPRGPRDVLAFHAYGRLLWAASSASSDVVKSPTPPPLLALQEHLARDPGLLRASVAALAAAVGISPAHLHLLCRRHWHTSPHRLLLERRITAAKRLLAGGKLPVKTVSAECGFDNVESFCRAFRRLTGQTPGTYRTQHIRPG